MSAEVLRRAAALMREHAEASLSPSPWHADDNSVWDADEHLVIASDVDILDEDIPHIASWHPAVALAVADWLDTSGADLWAHGPLCCAEGCMDCDDELWMPHVRRALAVARAYLGESA